MQDRIIRRILQTVALVVALVVQISLPLIYVAVSVADAREMLEFKARMTTGRVAKYVFAQPRLWQYQATRLSEVIEFPGVDQSDIRQSIYAGETDKLIYSTGNALSGPVIAHREALVVGGETVGAVVLETSLFPTFVHTGVIALLAFMLATLSFLTINQWPLRLVARTLGELKDQQEKTSAALLELEASDSRLRERSDQLIKAQELGRIGDWSLTIGLTAPFLSPVAMSLLRLRDGICPTYASLSERIEGDGSRQINAMVVDVVRRGVSAAADVRFRRGDGTMADLAVSCQVAERGDNGHVLCVNGTLQDVTERKEAERQLEALAYYDPLTGLANRSMFQRRLAQALKDAKESGQSSTLMLIDLDRFKEVNDSLGHAVGDELLVKVSHLLRRIINNEHFIARLGGDEFAIIVEGDPFTAGIAAIARSVVATLGKPIFLGRAEVLIGASIGIAVLPEHGTDKDEVIKNADLALYRAKDMGRGRFVLFELSMNEIIQHKMMLARDLRAAAAEDGGLEAWLQPQMDLARNSVIGFEALMRWNHTTLGYIPPSDFIPIAESSSLICDIGLWILRDSARMAKKWIDAGGPPYEVAVNVSAAQIWQTSIEKDVAAVLSESGLPPHLLVLELTESLLADHAEGRVRTALNGLKALGVQLALDDFGTGYSSLGYLIQLPFDKLKIDRLFVAEAPRSLKGREVLQGIISLGHGLGMKVVAEGVETPEELALLRAFGCDQVQGYLLARPAPAAAAFAFALKTLSTPGFSLPEPQASETASAA